MKINFSNKKICSIVKGRFIGVYKETFISAIAYDTRKIISGKNILFCALIGDFRDGHLYIKEAYDRGVRTFLVSKEINTSFFSDASFIEVSDTLFALQEIAKAHRNLFNFPIIAITGSVGKTMVKEWVYHFLSSKLRVIRSPKSFNSQLGVALSLLELNENCDVALIEVGISKPNEMNRLREIVKPSLGVFTSFGAAHKENFVSKEIHLEEKIALFLACEKTFFHASIPLNQPQIDKINGVKVDQNILNSYQNEIPFQDNVSIHNLEMAVQIAKEFSISEEQILSKIQSLPSLALRMETFEGINGNTIINDTYNLDFDALTQSLEYQFLLAEDRQRIVVIGLDEDTEINKTDIDKIISPFNPHKVIYTNAKSELDQIENSVVLIKGTRKSDMQKVAKLFRLKNHKTYLEIDLNAIRHNLSVFKGYLKPQTKVLAMVKSNSYGSGTERLAAFYEQQGIDYLGVAYVDEGVELRKQGISLPILVMNAEEDGFEDCIKYNLEPSIYSFSQLDQFIKELIVEGKVDYPIHLKLNTGMTRLGFEISEVGQLIESFQAQPEVKIKSVYSHLSDSDNLDSKEFTYLQIQRFEEGCNELIKQLNYSFDRHLLNSEGVSRFPEAQYEMVRLGIGMYGYSSNPLLKTQLQAAIFWKSSISQLKVIGAGESIGYGRTFIADKNIEIAIIPVGYADGFRRSLSNGKGGVYIRDKFCEVLGRVCMDMIMVNVSGINAKEGDPVEIIGYNQSMENFALLMETIPYEVMTSFSRRVHRVYLS